MYRKQIINDLEKNIVVRGNAVYNTIRIGNEKVFEYKVENGKVFAKQKVDEDDFGQDIYKWIPVRTSSFGSTILQQLNLTRTGLKHFLRMNGKKKYLPVLKKDLIKLLIEL